MTELPRRIHIIGSTGSGKTYLAKNLSKQLDIPYYELDKVMWSSSVEMAGKNSPEVRDKLLNEIIIKDSWIVEGVYYKWLAESFDLADKIIFLTPNTFVRDLRIINRFIKQRIGIEKSNYRQTLKGLLEMIKWNHGFEAQTKKEILEILKPYDYKLEILKNNNDIINEISSKKLSDLT
ncbi:DNA topology modulation protein FlaR [Paenibacillus xylanexedens]|uniref:DNA topology modulation protein FlaR n=1 Tax=Paenibacillus xylanexedens TaxID=528191 RepID=UPI0028EA18E7|nr:DNA topology modulation protein FlaR [Paenibacillus xylanexedens]